MTAAARAGHDGSWRLVAVLALLLFCGSHRQALQLSGFADDLGLLADLPQRAAQGSLLADVGAKWTGALWPGSTMWRPLPYSSFALDALLWGNAPGWWRITNLLLHAGVATFTGLIASRLTGRNLAGTAAFAILLLAPWSPEVTLWLVGRFDGWATLAIVLSLWAALKSCAADRWLLLSLMAAAAAYMSKESALVLPVWIALVVTLRALAAKVAPQNGGLSIARDAVRRHGALIGGHIALLVAYLVWRNYLFAGQAISVYASAPEYRVLPLLARMLAHLAFPVALAPLAPLAAAVAATIGAACLVLAARGDRRSVALVGAGMSLSVVVAVAIYFANPPREGEGYRLYYLATVGLALIVAAAIKISNKSTLALLLVFMSALAIWQSSVAAEWTRASRTVDGASRSMTSAATTLSPSEFGLVLLPDLMGHVPVARNAQGALLTSKNGSSPARDFFIIFTPPQLPEWHQLAQEDVVAKLTQRGSAPPRITRYFCFNSGSQSLEDLGYWPPGTLATWSARWRESVVARCPQIAL